MRQFNLSSMILSSLETYQHVVAEIAKEELKTIELKHHKFITLDDLCSLEFNEAFYIGMNEIQHAEECVNKYLLVAQDLDSNQIHGAMADGLTFFCELDEVDNYLIRVLKRLERRMEHNQLLDVEGSPIDLTYGVHPLDARDLREGDIGVFEDDDLKLFNTFIKSIKLGRDIHDLDIMHDIKECNDHVDAQSNRVEFDCDTMEIANKLFRSEIKKGMDL